MRRSPLLRDPARVKEWLDRSRRPLRRVGKRQARERSSLDQARQRVRGRVWCEAWGVNVPGTLLEYVCAETLHEGSDCHHVWPSDRDRGVHDPDRMLFLCRDAHRWVHDHPRLAGELGLLHRS